MEGRRVPAMTRLSASPRLDIELPAPLPSLSNAREHPFMRSARVALVHELVAAALAAQPVQPHQLLLPGQVLVVRLTRLAPYPLDDDNLASSLKAARDAVAHWLAVDDRQRLRVRYFPYQAKRAAVRLAPVGRQRKVRVYQTLRIEAFSLAVKPPLGATLPQLKQDAEVAALLLDAGEALSATVRAAGTLEQALGEWLGVDMQANEAEES